MAMCGGARRSPEIESLTSLKRGVFARRPLQVGEELDSTNVYFAMPLSAGQLLPRAGERITGRSS